jgi:hypothetical protein
MAKTSAKKASPKTAKKAAKPRRKAAPAAPAQPDAEPTLPSPEAGLEAEPQLEEAMADTVPDIPMHEPVEDAAEAPPVPEGAHWAEQVAAARSAPVHIHDDAGTVQVGQAIEEADAGMETGAGDLEVRMDTGEEEAAPRRAAAIVQATGQVGIPEQFLTIAIDGQWDDRMERVKPGRMGAAIVGSLLLELAIVGKLKVQRDHFVIEEGTTGDPALDAFAEQVQELGPIPTAQAVRKLGRRLTDRVRPWKERAARHGWLREERRRFLGVLPRSTTYVLDEEVQGKLQNRLVRMLAGGGNPDVKSIALLGLIQSAGLLGQMVPSSALAFNEKRISLLLSGRDPLHYRVDTSVRQVQDLALRTILSDVRKLR